MAEKKKKEQKIKVRIPHTDRLNISYLGKPGVYNWENGDVFIEGTVLMKTGSEHVLKLTKNAALILEDWVIRKYKVKPDYSKVDYILELSNLFKKELGATKGDDFFYTCHDRKKLEKLSDWELSYIIEEMEDIDIEEEKEIDRKISELLKKDKEELDCKVNELLKKDKEEFTNEEKI